ncbi:hypothetical protein GALL_351830 [mine drainage metagenome]|uniref:Uncharacterized protein n=1 Tax=mine drainage metagenome TaxID=410659 RepID=A0A1J5QHM9_9ZZZZ
MRQRQRAHRVDQTPAQRGQCGIAQPRRDDDELLAAVARGERAGLTARLGADRGGHLAQAVVAAEVAGEVVVALEVVDIEHDHAQRLAGALPQPPLLGHAAVQAAPVGQPGQSVLLGQPLQPGVGRVQAATQRGDPVHRLHLGQQHRLGDRFGNEVVGAGFDRRHQVVVAVRRGQENDRRPRPAATDFLGADALRRLQPVDAGHLEVHQHQVRRVRDEGVDRGQAVGGDDDVETEPAQPRRHHQGGRRRVVHQQDLHGSLKGPHGPRTRPLCQRGDAAEPRGPRGAPSLSRRSRPRP